MAQPQPPQGAQITRAEVAAALGEEQAALLVSPRAGRRGLTSIYKHVSKFAGADHHYAPWLAALYNLDLASRSFATEPEAAAWAYLHGGARR